MQCPSCQNTDSRVLESRAADGGRSVRRRRECLNCEFRFTTYERVETVPITVIKRNGNREIFSRSKLLHGLNRACEKTGLDTSRLESLVEELELKLQQRTGKEVSSTEIGEFLANLIFEQGQCAIPVPVLENKSISSLFNFTQWACHTSLPTQPNSFIYSPGVIPKCCLV